MALSESHRGDHRWASVLVACAVFGCQDGGTIEVMPTEVVLIGLDQQDTLQPTVRNDKGRRLKVMPTDLSWSSSDGKIVTVDKDGVLTSVGFGSAEVSVSLGLKTGTARVRVAKPTRLQIVPDSVDLIAAGLPVRLEAKVFDEADVEIATKIITWASADKGIARIESGEVQGLNVGHTKVTAKCGDATGEAAVTVRYPKIARLKLEETRLELDVGDTQVLPVYAFDAHDAPLRLVSLAYKSSKPKVASVSEDGVITARRAGTTVVIVSGSGQTAKATVRVFR